MIRDTARAYAQEKLAPRVIEAYLEEKTDRAIFDEMGALGLLGVDDPREVRLRRRQLRRPMAWSRARSSASIRGYRSMNSVQSSLVMYPIYAYGSEDAAREVPAEARDRASGSAASA